MEIKIPGIQPAREIVSKRTVHFPQALVFTAWTDPDHLQNWWGPAGFTNTFTTFDLRAGGKWNFIMHGPEKGNYINECEFVQVVEPELIWWKRFSQPLFQVVVTLNAAGNDATEIVFRMIFDTVEESDKLRSFAPGKNEENFDKLEEELKLMMRE